MKHSINKYSHSRILLANINFPSLLIRGDNYTGCRKLEHDKTSQAGARKLFLTFIPIVMNGMNELGEGRMRIPCIGVARVPEDV